MGYSRKLTEIKTSAGRSIVVAVFGDDGKQVGEDRIQPVGTKEEVLASAEAVAKTIATRYDQQQKDKAARAAEIAQQQQAEDALVLQLAPEFAISKPVDITVKVDATVNEQINEISK